jgi:uncharacterized repeat protein (TIGR03833 family)
MFIFLKNLGNINDYKKEPVRIMLSQKRENIKIGSQVKVVQKADQRSGKLTEGIVTKILTNSPTHPHGIKVMLENGVVGRVKEIL